MTTMMCAGRWAPRIIVITHHSLVIVNEQHHVNVQCLCAYCENSHTIH